ncbi:hypothetical protein ScalyP_jg10250 [Parmales sp. scaly parma]|nr:hypothetical protein ScalyP_jg10250 [Parmales sp. scaly parma]
MSQLFVDRLTANLAVATSIVCPSESGAFSGTCRPVKDRDFDYEITLDGVFHRLRSKSKSNSPTISLISDLDSVALYESPTKLSEKITSYLSHEEHRIAHLQILQSGRVLIISAEKLLAEKNRGRLLCADCDKNGSTCLMWAAGADNLELAKHLILTLGVDQNAHQIGRRSFCGRTALHWAARFGHARVVEFLIEQRSTDVDATTEDGTSAFCWAAWGSHLEVMELLVGCKKKCNIEKVNSFGCTAMLWWSQGTSPHPAVFDYLIELKFRADVVNNNGHSVFHKMAQRGRLEACRHVLNNWNWSNWDATGCTKRDAENLYPSDLAMADDTNRGLVDLLLDVEKRARAHR